MGKLNDRENFEHKIFKYGPYSEKFNEPINVDQKFKVDCFCGCGVVIKFRNVFKLEIISVDSENRTLEYDITWEQVPGWGDESEWDGCLNDIRDLPEWSEPDE